MTSRVPQTLAFLFTTFPPDVTGAAYFNWERIQWLARRGNYRIVVLAPAPPDNKPPLVIPEDIADRLVIESYPSKSWLVYNLLRVPTFNAARLIREKLLHHKPDLITVVDVERLFFFSTWHLPGRSYAKTKNIPYITEYHTDYYSFASTYPGGNFLREIILKPLTRLLYHQCDQVIAISATAAKSLQQLGVTNAHSIDICGLELSLYSPDRRDRQWLAPWLTEAESDHKVILFLGRLALEKRVDLVIEAFAKLKARYSKCSLLIAGDGPSETTNKLKQLAKQVPHVHFTGFIQGEAKANLIASSDVFCSAAPYETFGLTVVEAMASGVPVVTVNSGGVTEYLVNGVNAHLTSPNNVAELAQQLESTLCSDDNQAMIDNALETTQQLSLEKGCVRLNQYYQQLLALKSSTYERHVMEAVSVETIHAKPLC